MKVSRKIEKTNKTMPIYGNYRATEYNEDLSLGRAKKHLKEVLLFVIQSTIGCSRKEAEVRLAKSDRDWLERIRNEFCPEI